MSEKKFSPAELRFLFLAGGTAFVVTAVCLAAMAAWMVAQKCPGTAAEPLAAAAVGVGSFCGGWVAAFCKKERGLICGLVQGVFYAALLCVLSIPSGAITESGAQMRFAIVILCGSIGGFLGIRHKNAPPCTYCMQGDAFKARIRKNITSWGRCPCSASRQS